jgi:hypothetical protein
MGKINLDPRVFYGILVVVAIVAALLVFKAADSKQKAPLPDPNMFKMKSAQTTHV